MGGLVIDLQAAALNPSSRASDLLRTALAVSRKLHQTEMIDWLSHELNGYDEYEDIPDYRAISGEIKAWNPYNGWIPFTFESPEEARQYTVRKIAQSIGALEALDLTRTVCIHLPPEIKSHLTSFMAVKLDITMFVPANLVSSILSVVKNKILDWALVLESKGILGEDLRFSEKEVEQSKSIVYNFNTTIESMSNSQIQQASPNSTMSLDVSGADILPFVDALKKNLTKLRLQKNFRKQVAIDIGRIEAQLAEGSPRQSVIQESVRSIRTVLEGATGNLLASGILCLIPALLK